MTSKPYYSNPCFSAAIFIISKHEVDFSYHNPNRLAEPAQDGGQKSLMLNCRQTVSKTNTKKEEHKYNRNKDKLNKQKQANE